MTTESIGRVCTINTAKQLQLAVNDRTAMRGGERQFNPSKPHLEPHFDLDPVSMSLFGLDPLQSTSSHSSTSTDNSWSGLAIVVGTGGIGS